MSHMTVCVDNSVPPKERRVRVRHPLGALAYLDIGADNGGIILNVSEEGLALQAAAPLDQQKEISLRIQLPRSEKPIETAARIVWLGQSNRQAGVRFLAMPAAARAQIQEWMRSAPAPGSSEDPHTEDSRAARAAVPLPEPIQDSQQEKWLSLMADFAAHQSARPAAAGANSDALAGVPPAPATPVLHPRPEIVSREFGKRKQQEASAPAIEAPVVRRPYTQEQAATAAKPRTSGSPVSTGSGALSNLLVPPPAIPVSTILAPSSGFPAKTGMDAMEAARNAVRQAAEAAVRRTRARNQISVVAAIVLFSILCFGIGTWVGPLINRQVAPPVIATPVPPVT
ncbi:MAG TPA: PilZ domain-containing protein, partial [Terriglobales bacterium]|nr:PilZ domain-containing protein [Terriglobales bacterium]